MAITLIGIDCATQAKNIGLARGIYEAEKAQVDEVFLGAGNISIVEMVAGWITNTQNALIAMDAPLGWPKALGVELHTHTAGESIRVESNQMFRRETDLFIKRKIGKQPLDVGADRIARTAHAALTLLDEIRAKTGEVIHLSWKPGLSIGNSVIEVYPAASLIAYNINAPGYKHKDGQDARTKLLSKLRGQIGLPADLSLMENSDDAIDAAVCVLAGADFLRGEVYEPTDLTLAKKEGWIWVRRRD